MDSAAHERRRRRSCRWHDGQCQAAAVASTPLLSSPWGIWTALTMLGAAGLWSAHTKLQLIHGAYGFALRAYVDEDIS